MTLVTFAEPQRLWLLVLVAALVLGYALRQRTRHRYALRFTAVPMLALVAPRRPGWRRHVGAALAALALGTMVVASAVPQLAGVERRERATVVLALDTSPSMMASDVPPSRLVVATDAATEFIDGLPDTFDVGLVTFAGTARLVVPPTTDHDLVRQRLAEVDLRSETAIGEAIAVALDALAPAAAQGSVGAPAPHILVLSDGANTVGVDPLAAAESAAARQVPVSTVSYGTPEGTIELGGRTQPVPPDPQVLAAIAELTDGRAMRAATAGELRDAYRRITTELISTDVQRDVSDWPLLGALLLALLGGVLNLVWFRHLP
ncbi:VWA domain-containing protein [soil metagenome]